MQMGYAGYSLVGVTGAVFVYVLVSSVVTKMFMKNFLSSIVLFNSCEMLSKILLIFYLAKETNEVFFTITLTLYFI